MHALAAASVSLSASGAGSAGHFLWGSQGRLPAPRPIRLARPDVAARERSKHPLLGVVALERGDLEVDEGGHPELEQEFRPAFQLPLLPGEAPPPAKNAGPGIEDPIYLPIGGVDLLSGQSRMAEHKMIAFIMGEVDRKSTRLNSSHQL